MKQLFLIRHAKSSWADDSLSDRERPLNARGNSQLAPLGRALAAHKAFAGKVYASEATRARQTLAGVLPATVPQSQTQICPQLYTFDHRKLVQWLRTLDDEASVALIGHNPALLELAQWLTASSPTQLPTGSFIHLHVPIRHWHGLEPGQATLEAFLTPRDFSYTQFARKYKENAGANASSRDLADTLQRLHRWLSNLEQGVVLGLDDEFLHQYRVALRRSRAIVESVREVSGAKHLSAPLQQLKQRAAETSLLRDMHVFLQQLPTLCAGNGELETGLRTYFELAIANEQRQLVKRLTGKPHQKRSNEWRKLIESRTFRKLTRSLSHKDIRSTVHKRISDCNRAATALTADATDEQVHRLRKQLKRTRYLMELEPERWKDLLKRVRRRQELFGQFQDTCVQLLLLQHFRDDASEVLPAAIAGLDSRLTEQKTDFRQQILALGGRDGSPL